MVKTSSLIGKKYPWTIVPTPCGHFLKGLTEVESPTWACQPSLAGYSLKAIKGNKKNPQSDPLSASWLSCEPLPCHSLLAAMGWTLWSHIWPSFSSSALWICSQTHQAPYFMWFFLYNLLSPDSVAYVCTLVPVLQHICRGLRTTLESLFSPPTRDPTNKTQVVQLPWQVLLPMEASLHPRRCSIFILSLASIVLKIERKLF